MALPLESTESNVLAHNYHFVDVFSTEGWALEVIPQPFSFVSCIISCPVTEQQLKCKKGRKNRHSATTSREMYVHETTDWNCLWWYAWSPRPLVPTAE